MLYKCSILLIYRAISIYGIYRILALDSDLIFADFI